MTPSEPVDVMVIGITGLIGSGKTLAAEILREFGAYIIDADIIGREVVESSDELKRKLSRAFGSDVLTHKGNLRRAVVADRAFANQASRRKLNEIVHPYLLRELRRQLRAARKVHNLVVVDAALLLEWNLDRETDMVLLVHASHEIRIKRLQARGISRKDALARTRLQAPYREYRKQADLVVWNNGSRSDLSRKIRSKLQSLSK